MSHSHIYVAASGYGLRVIPRSAPYRYRLSSEPPNLEVECCDGGEWRFAVVIPTGGGYRSRIAEPAESLAEVADIVAGPDYDGWWLDTSRYRVPLPPGWTAVSDQISPPFDLVGPDGSLVYIQTPGRQPSLSDLPSPGQDVLGTGGDALGEWIDVAYVHEGVE